MLRVAVRATAASLGLAIFVDVPSKNQPHALKLKRADAAGATYRGVAANATQSSLRNFQLSLDAVFAPCDEATFETLKRAYGGWSASRSAVAWEAGRDFRLSDLLPPLAQALCGRRFTPTTSGDVLCNANCWGFAYSVLEAAAAPSDSVTVSAGAHGDAWAALVAVTDRVQSTLEQGHDLLGEQRNAALAPGDVLMLWHQNTGEEMYLDHVAILVDDDLYLEKAGSGAETPFRLIDWDGLVASWPPAVFEWDWRRRKRGTAVPPAREAFGSRLAPKGARADALSVSPYAGTEQLSWVKTLDEPLTMDDRGRAALPPAAFEAAAFAVVDGADPREPTSSKGEAKVAKWTPLAVDGPVPLGRVPAAMCVFGGGLYIFGGETDDTRPWVPIPNRYLNDVWRLDLRSGRWEELSPDGAEGAPDPRVCAAAVASDSVWKSTSELGYLRSMRPS